jgi:hypothetical protein
VSEFDEAILSRIHLLLRDENLKKKARKNIWKGFLRQAGTQNGVVTIGPKHLESLTEADRIGKTSQRGEVSRDPGGEAK